MSQDCIFCRIARGEIPSRKVYEDEDVLAFHDINPAAPVHFLIIPKVHVVNLYDADMKHQDVLGKILDENATVGALSNPKRLAFVIFSLHFASSTKVEWSHNATKRS